MYLLKQWNCLTGTTFPGDPVSFHNTTGSLKYSFGASGAEWEGSRVAMGPIAGNIFDGVQTITGAKEIRPYAGALPDEVWLYTRYSTAPGGGALISFRGFMGAVDFDHTHTYGSDVPENQAAYLMRPGLSVPLISDHISVSQAAFSRREFWQRFTLGAAQGPQSYGQEFMLTCNEDATAGIIDRSILYFYKK